MFSANPVIGYLPQPQIFSSGVKILILSSSSGIKEYGNGIHVLGALRFFAFY